LPRIGSLVAREVSRRRDEGAAKSISRGGSSTEVKVVEFKRVTEPNHSA